jgi:hypothetical protein
MGWSERDLTRLAFSAECRELSDLARAFVPARCDGSGPPGGLVENALRLRASAEYAVRLAVAAERARGSSWRDIGGALGCTRQAAHERYAAAVDEITKSVVFPMRGGGGPDEGCDLDAAVHALVDGALPPGVSERTARRMLLEAKIREYELIAATQTGARARDARRASAGALHELVRWHRADVRDRLGHIAYSNTEAVITYDGRPVQVLQRHNDPADEEASGWLLCSIGDQSRTQPLTGPPVPAALDAALQAAAGLYADDEVIAGVDAPQTMALAAALDRVCDHIASDAANGCPPFGPGGIAGPLTS